MYLFGLILSLDSLHMIHIEKNVSEYYTYIILRHMRTLAVMFGSKLREELRITKQKQQL